MTAKSEYDAAYFTMLRAIEERDGLLRYGELLEEEQRRLDAFVGALRAPSPEVPDRMRRPLDDTVKPVVTALARRREVVLDERRRLADRLEAAEAFVTECEAEVAALRP